jgi:hypothetical protein
MRRSAPTRPPSSKPSAGEEVVAEDEVDDEDEEKGPKRWRAGALATPTPAIQEEEEEKKKNETQPVAEQMEGGEAAPSTPCFGLGDTVADRVRRACGEAAIVEQTDEEMQDQTADGDKGPGEETQEQNDGGDEGEPSEYSVLLARSRKHDEKDMRRRVRAGMPATAPMSPTTKEKQQERMAEDAEERQGAPVTPPTTPARKCLTGYARVPTRLYACS